MRWTQGEPGTEGGSIPKQRVCNMPTLRATRQTHTMTRHPCERHPRSMPQETSSCSNNTTEQSNTHRHAPARRSRDGKAPPRVHAPGHQPLPHILPKLCRLWHIHLVVRNDLRGTTNYAFVFGGLLTSRNGGGSRSGFGEQGAGKKAGTKVHKYCIRRSSRALACAVWLWCGVSTSDQKSSELSGMW